MLDAIGQSGCGGPERASDQVSSPGASLDTIALAAIVLVNSLEFFWATNNDEDIRIDQHVESTIRDQITHSKARSQGASEAC